MLGKPQCGYVRCSVSAGGAVLSLVLNYMTVPFAFIHKFDISIRSLLWLYDTNNKQTKPLEGTELQIDVHISHKVPAVMICNPSENFREKHRKSWSAGSFY